MMSADGKRFKMTVTYLSPMRNGSSQDAALPVILRANLTIQTEVEPC